MDVEQENTFRALNDEPAIALWQWRCKFKWHRWTCWSNPYIPNNGKFNVQNRECVDCNLVQLRRISDML